MSKCYECRHRIRIRNPYLAPLMRYKCGLTAERDAISGSFQMLSCANALRTALCKFEPKPTLIQRLKEVFS